MTSIYHFSKNILNHAQLQVAGLHAWSLFAWQRVCKLVYCRMGSLGVSLSDPRWYICYHNVHVHARENYILHNVEWDIYCQTVWVQYLQLMFVCPLYRSLIVWLLHIVYHLETSSTLLVVKHTANLHILTLSVPQSPYDNSFETSIQHLYLYYEDVFIIKDFILPRLFITC
jgi:hypothetical protein